MSPIPRPSKTSLCLNPQLKTDAPRLLHLDATGGEAIATVYPQTAEARRDNYHNNTIEKALR